MTEIGGHSSSEIILQPPSHWKDKVEPELVACGSHREIGLVKSKLDEIIEEKRVDPGQIIQPGTDEELEPCEVVFEIELC